jgi:hypothetical protein
MTRKIKVSGLTDQHVSIFVISYSGNSCLGWLDVALEKRHWPNLATADDGLKADAHPKLHFAGESCRSLSSDSDIVLSERSQYRLNRG